jgi:hypothetical protein
MISQHTVLTPNTETLFVSLYPSAVGGGKLISGDGSDGPFPRASKGVLGEGDVGQVLFHLWEEKKVNW